MTDLTAAELDVLEALLEKATPGPWEFDAGDIGADYSVPYSEICGTDGEPVIGNVGRPNGEWIEAINNAAPALIATARLKAELAEANAKVSETIAHRAEHRANQAESERDAERRAREEAERETEAVRTLMNIYNLGGWTDSLALLKRAEAAEQRVAALESALTDIAQGPEPMDEYLRGIRCGVEDRDLQGHVYAAAEYGYEQGIEYCRVIADAALTQSKEEK